MEKEVVDSRTPWEQLSQAERDTIEDLIQTMEQRVSLSVTYDGLSRVIEVHAIGLSRKGNPCIRVWQSSGESVSGEVPGWKMMLLSRLDSYSFPFSVLDVEPRPGYQRGDKGMIHIFKEL